MPDDHNRDIAQAASAILKPIGCFRKGRSRTWLDDQGWWLGVVEFQPSSWSKGSYLNVAACFLWNEKDYLSFDDLTGDRPWHDAIAGQSFREKADKLAKQARAALSELRKRHETPALTAGWLSERERFSNWTHFHAAIAHGLSGNASAAYRHFRAARLPDANGDWVMEFNRKCTSLAEIVVDEKLFAATIVDTIHRTRERLRLPTIQNLHLTG